MQLEVALKGHASIPAQQSGCSVKCVETGTTACVQTLTARQLSKTVMFFVVSCVNWNDLSTVIKNHFLKWACPTCDKCTAFLVSFSSPQPLELLV